MTKLVPIILCIFISWGCTKQEAAEKKQTYPEEGQWRAELTIQDHQLPFNFQIVKDTTTEEDKLLFIFENADEKLEVSKYSIKGDSIIINMHIFDTQIMARFSDDKMDGIWRKNYISGYDIPFKALRNQTHRFPPSDELAAVDYSGRWAVKFQEEDTFDLAVGEFVQNGSRITGTFLTTVGDYRFLEGQVKGDSLYMSCFDGEHAFLFIAGMNDREQLEGLFLSGQSWNQQWTAERDEDIVLPDADSLTYLKKGYSKIAFEFPNEDGQIVTLEDDQFKNKVVVVQIMGSWCPNCMDETRFLSDWYKRNKTREVAIVGLTFERKDDFAYASQRINIMKEKFNIEYEILFAGKANKKVASEALPMLNKIISFPTTIIIDKGGVVRNIHTGFSGPGTGKYYEQYVDEFNQLMNELLEEEVI